MRPRELLLWTVLAILGVFIWYYSSASSSTGGRQIEFADFMKRVDAGAIGQVVISDRHIVATPRGRGERVATNAPEDPSTIVPKLMEHGVHIEVKPASQRGGILTYVFFLYTSSVLPWFTFILILVAFARLRAIERRIDALHGASDREDAP